MSYEGTSDDLLCEVRDKVAWVTINREGRRNALSRAVQQQMPALMTALGIDPDVWAVVIRGAGDRAFCAGNDLKEVDGAREAGRSIPTPMQGAYRNVFECVLEVPKPTIASINGFALAGGFELAMACDLRIAAEHAEFGMPEARIGMGANFATVVLPRLIPRALAFELLYTGNRITAQRAVEVGLVNMVVSRDKLTEETERLVAGIVANAPLTIRRYKEMMLKGWELPVSSALRLNVGPNPYTSRDREEGVRAFLEKRPPHWEGR